MKTAFINGSPRAKTGSTSGFLLSALKAYLPEAEYYEAAWNQKPKKKEEYDQVLMCDVIVLSFPLYVDGVPSHVLSHLEAMEEYAKHSGIQSECTVYVLVNNGFYDAKQNHIAMDIIKNWCAHMKFTYGQGIGFGGGGMIGSLNGVPNDQGPKKNIGEALKRLAIAIPNKETKPNEFILPNFPAIGYKLMAQHGWRVQVRKNGMRPKALKRKIEYFKNWD